MRSIKWTAPAVLATAALLLSACSGGGTTPSTPGLNGVSGAMHSGQQKHLTIVNVHPNGKKPPVCNTSEFPAGCFSFSQSGGLDITWCYGPPSSPCEDTSEISDWNGNVLSEKTGKTVKGIKVTWSGPFPCTASTCGTGSYELDSMVSGRKEPKLAKKYVDVQDIGGCLSTASCGQLTDIGLDVVP
jgi:hypothetical protein